MRQASAQITESNLDYRYRFAGLFVFLAGCVAVFRLGDANGQDRPPGTFLENVRFQKIESKPVKGYSYANGNFNTDYDDKGHCRITGANFLVEKYGLSFSASCRLQTGDVIAMLGGVFRAKCDSTVAVWDRIPDAELPKGAKLPEWDSITVPLSEGAGFNVGPEVVTLKVQQIDAKRPTDPMAALEITFRVVEEKPSKKKAIVSTATVKTGDIVLLRDKGHLVRAIVPANRETRVVGWVELSPHPIPEAELIRDKKVFVRPMPKDEKAK